MISLILKNKLVNTLVVILTINVFFNWVILYNELDYSYSIIWKVIISLILFYLIKKQRLGFFDIFKSKKELLTSIIFLVLCFLILQSNFESESYSVAISSNLLFLFFCLSTGIFEELLFRVFTFNSVSFKIKNKSYLKSTIITSLLFSLAHFSILIYNKETNIFFIISQINFAFFIGFLLQSIYLLRRSIILPILIHTLINYFGSYKKYLLNIIVVNNDTSYNLKDFTFHLLTNSIFLSLIILPISLFFINKSQKRDLK